MSSIKDSFNFKHDFATILTLAKIFIYDGKV